MLAFHVDAWRGSQEVSRSHAVPGGGQNAPSRLRGVCFVCFKGRLKAYFPLKSMLPPARLPSRAAGEPVALALGLAFHVSSENLKTWRIAFPLQVDSGCPQWQA